jgi:hypothetical protein
MSTAPFIQPIAGGSVTIQVLDSSWGVPGEIVYVAGGGYYLLQATPSATQMQLQNLDYPGNTTPGLPVGSAAGVTPGGLQGPAGPEGPYESTFGSAITVTNAAFISIGVNGFFINFIGVNGRKVATPKTVSNLTVSIPTPIPANQQMQVAAAISIDDGTNYASIGSFAVLNAGSKNATVSFPPTLLFANSLHCILVQYAGGPGLVTYTGPLSATLS